MAQLHAFLDYLYDFRLLNRNGLSVMQEFLRICERNQELEEQVVCKLASYIKSLSASDCYDLSNRLLQQFKQSKKEQDNNDQYEYQSTPQPLKLSYSSLTPRETLNKRQDNTYTFDNNSSIQSLEKSNNIKQQQILRKFDWKKRIQVNDKLKSLSNILNKQLLRTGFQQLQDASSQTAKTKRQLSPQALKMSNIIKQQLNSVFQQQECKKTLIKNNNIQKIVDKNQLSRNQSNEDLKWKNGLKDKAPQNSIIKNNSPETLKKSRSHMSSYNNLSLYQSNAKLNNSSSKHSPSKSFRNDKSILMNSPIQSLKENLNKEIIDSNQHLKLNASDIRLSYLNLKESFKLIHEQLEADLLTNTEAISLINSIKQKHYDKFCTFTPNINKENQYYEKIKTRDIRDPFERLYKDGIEHKLNKSQILTDIKSCLELKDCTFHPNLQKSASKSRNVKFAGTLTKFPTFSKENESDNYL